jgi:hypothetical protein
MRTGMIAAEALRDILNHGVSETKGFAAYQAQCRKAFLLSFNAARLFRAAVSSPILDGLAVLTQQPPFKHVLGRLLAEM